MLDDLLGKGATEAIIGPPWTLGETEKQRYYREGYQAAERAMDAQLQANLDYARQNIAKAMRNERLGRHLWRVSLPLVLLNGVLTVLYLIRFWRGTH